jgi:hypothetical protein
MKKAAGRYVESVHQLAVAVGCSDSAIKRAIAAGRIVRTTRGFDVGKGRTAISLQRSRAKAGTVNVAVRGDLEALQRNVEQREELYEWDKRGRRAKALIGELELAEKSKRVLPMLTVRKAWRACESLWVQQCRTIARQVGANWGGKLGKEIEALTLKLHAEMFKRMAADRILSGGMQAEERPTRDG